MLPGLREVYAAYVREASTLPDLPSALQGELWTSAQLGTLEAAAPHAEGRRLALADLVGSLLHAATPGARTFLLALAAIGPAGVRRAAREAANGLDGLPEPSWSPLLGQVTPGLSWLIQEGPLDGDRLVCEFRYADGADPHALAVRLAPQLPSEIVVVGDVPGMMAEARKAVRAELCTVQPIAPAAVGARLKAVFAAEPELPEECYPALALARHRVAAMPG